MVRGSSTQKRNVYKILATEPDCLQKRSFPPRLAQPPNRRVAHVCANMCNTAFMQLAGATYPKAESPHFLAAACMHRPKQPARANSTHFCARAVARAGPPGPCIVARWLVTRIGINLNLNRAECVCAGRGRGWGMGRKIRLINRSNAIFYRALRCRHACTVVVLNSTQNVEHAAWPVHRL